ncbi:MAG: Bax inhibitor-1/YccA family protein [Pseudomonadota bacterium]
MADYQTIRSGVGARAAEIDAGLRAHMSKVYGTMSIGMLITAAAAWAIAGLATTSDPSAAYQVDGQLAAFREGQFLTGLGYAIYASPLRWVIMFAPLAVLFLGMGPVMRRASASGAQLFFFGFATLIGLSLSSIFLVYTAFSITQTFLVTAIAFAGLSLYGYTTKKDLSGWGTFLMMGVIGLLVAMIINIFLQSPAMMFAISGIGVLIFAGLTAYDTQTIKSEYVAHAQYGDQEWLDKSAIHGALSLYLNFLNMFQFLLMFMGQQE